MHVRLRQAGLLAAIPESPRPPELARLPPPRELAARPGLAVPCRGAPGGSRKESGRDVPVRLARLGERYKNFINPPEPEQCEEAARATPGRTEPAHRCIPASSADLPRRRRRRRRHAQKKEAAHGRPRVPRAPALDGCHGNGTGLRLRRGLFAQSAAVAPAWLVAPGAFPAPLQLLPRFTANPPGPSGCGSAGSPLKLLLRDPEWIRLRNELPLSVKLPMTEIYIPEVTNVGLSSFYRLKGILKEIKPR
ncbi:hypothetical protein NN561_013260 [Cricetulus griseus]